MQTAPQPQGDLETEEKEEGNQDQLLNFPCDVRQMNDLTVPQFPYCEILFKLLLTSKNVSPPFPEGRSLLSHGKGHGVPYCMPVRPR